MATRRIVSSEKTILDREDGDSNVAGSPTKSNISPAVPTFELSGVIVKLLGFTAAMVIGPIGTYFLSLKTIYNGNSTWAGATAAIMANVVLIAYVIVAFKDDESERHEAEAKARKGL